MILVLCSYTCRLDYFDHCLYKSGIAPILSLYGKKFNPKYVWSSLEKLNIQICNKRRNSIKLLDNKTLLLPKTPFSDLVHTFF